MSEVLPRFLQIPLWVKRSWSFLLELRTPERGRSPHRAVRPSVRRSPGLARPASRILRKRPETDRQAYHSRRGWSAAQTPPGLPDPAGIRPRPPCRRLGSARDRLDFASCLASLLADNP